MRHMSANRQWKVIDERGSGNISRTITDIPRIFRALSTWELRKLRKKYTKQRKTASTLTQSWVLSCSIPEIAYSTDPANFGRQLLRFHVRKTDEMRKLLMYCVRLILTRDSCVYATFGQCGRALMSQMWTNRSALISGASIPFLVNVINHIVEIFHYFNCLVQQLFTRGQFWTSGIVIAHVCVPVSVCVSITCLSA